MYPNNYTLENLNRFIQLLDKEKVLVSVISEVGESGPYLYIELMDAQEGHIFDGYETDDTSSESIKAAIVWIALILS